MLESLRRFSGSEVAKERLRIIKFYEKWGEKATKEAFAVDRKLISKWRKSYQSYETEISQNRQIKTKAFA